MTGHEGVETLLARILFRTAVTLLSSRSSASALGFLHACACCHLLHKLVTLAASFLSALAHGLLTFLQSRLACSAQFGFALGFGLATSIEGSFHLSLVWGCMLCSDLSLESVGQARLYFVSVGLVLLASLQ